MRRSILLYLSLPLLFGSCEENFSPKEPFSEKYVLYAVIENSLPYTTPYVSATIRKTYDEDGYVPSANHPDNTVSGCNVIITVKNKETALEQVGGFYLGAFNSVPNELVKIKAELPNGKILTAETNIPGIIPHLDFSYQFKTGIHTYMDQSYWGKTWRIEWDSYEDDLYFPRLILSYAKKEGSELKLHHKEIPLKYVQRNHKTEAVYPSYTWGKSIEYSYDSFDSVMTSISAGDSLKENYFISSISFGLIEYEKNLAAYYSSTHGYLDNYSIRLDESTYSNVNGGIGVFGACTETYQIFDVNRKYIESFGYNHY